MNFPQEFETVVVVGPDSELQAREKRRAAYAMKIAQLDEGRQFRPYLSRMLQQLEEFDVTLDRCLRNGLALEPARQVFHELFEKFSNVIDQVWVAVWEARIAPHVTWQNANQASNARHHVHFPVLDAESDLANATRGTHIAEVVRRDTELLDAVLAPQRFICGDDFISEIKRIAAQKHRGVLTVASVGPQISLSGHPGQVTTTRFKVEQWHGGERLFRLTALGRWVDPQGGVHPIPEACLWLTYWGQISVEGVEGDGARFVHGIFELVVRVVQDFERLLRPLP